MERGDLHASNLAGSVLRSADLSEVFFRRCNLRGADLTGAVLRRADLRAANLRGAILRGADLVGARIFRASLRGARADEATRWPEGFDPEARGVIVARAV